MVAMSVTPDEIRKTQLPTALRGYERGAVDKLLATVADSLEALAKERDELRQRVEKLEAELGSHVDSQELMRDALLSAQRVAEELKERTRKECDELLEKARKEAEEIETEALREREQVEESIERLRTQERELRASYRVLLHAALDRLGEESVQERTGVEPSLLEALAPRTAERAAKAAPAPAREG